MVKFSRRYSVWVFIVSDQFWFLPYIQSFLKCSSKAPRVNKIYVVFSFRLEKITEVSFEKIISVLL